MYIFDFDGTIYDGDSSIDFFTYSLKKHKKSIFRIPFMMISILLYKLKIISKTKMKESLFSFVKDSKDIDKDIKDFWKINSYKIKDYYKNRKSYSNDIIISASPLFLLEPFKDMYKIKDIIASDVDKKTGKFIGLNCYGEEKVKRYKKKYKDEIKEVYTDSLSDKPLLNIAKKGFIVTKDEIIPYDESISKIKKTTIYNLYKTYEEIINYLIIGAFTVLVTLVVYYLLTLFLLNPNDPLQLQISNIISWIGAVLFAYVTNRKFVFKSKNKDISKEIISFTISRVTTLLIDMGIMFIFVSSLGLNDKIFKLISQVVVIILNYVFSKIFVFKK